MDLYPRLCAKYQTNALLRSSKDIKDTANIGTEYELKVLRDLVIISRD